MNVYLRNFEAYRKMVLNAEWKSDKKIMDNISKDINALTRRAFLEGTISCYFKHYNPDEPLFSPIPDSLNSLIIDIEGSNPLKLIGLLTQDKMFFYMLKPQYEKDFYKFIAKLLKILRKVLLFGFTFWDLDSILRVKEDLIYKYGFDKDKLKYFDDLLYFNLQEYDHENVSSALYSLGMTEIPKDPLYRKSSHVNKLFKDGFYDIIQQHNFSCLACESFIFLKRFIPKHIITLQTGERN